MFPWVHYTISLSFMATEILWGKSHGHKKKSVVSLIPVFRNRFSCVYYNTWKARPSPCCTRAMRYAVKKHSRSHSQQCKRGKQKHREMMWEPEKRGPGKLTAFSSRACCRLLPAAPCSTADTLKQICHCLTDFCLPSQQTSHACFADLPSP